jgi:flagellar assembly protein FliH
MASNTKFLFDNEFGADPSTPARKEAEAAARQAPLLYSEEDRERFCAEAREQALQQGRAEAVDSIEASLTRVMDTMSAQLQHMVETHGARLENTRREAASLAFAIAGKLAPTLLAQQPETEILKLIETCLVDLHDEPRIVVRASEPVCEALSARVEQFTRTTGFQGNVILLPDETKSGSDCRVEWADGGVERDLATTIAHIEEIIDRFVRADRAAQ